MTAEIAVALAVARALESGGVRYLLGGSLASSYAGEPRSTLAVDMVAELNEAGVAPLASLLGADFYLDPEAARSAVRARSCFNLIHHDSGIRVDLFIAHTRLDRLQMDRRHRIVVGGDAALNVYTPEDILLQKLLWYRRGGEVSERQWRDVVGIVATQGPALDREYLRVQAGEAGVRDLLARLLT